jgi:hypothetical protein
MPTTPILQLPYPAATDPADVPTDMGELATRIETVRGAVNGLASLGADGKVPAAQLPAAAAGAGAELVYAQITANMTISGGAGSPTLIVQTPAYTFDGSTVVYLEFHTPGAQIGASDQLIFLCLEDAPSIATFPPVSSGGSAVVILWPVFYRFKWTPAAGSHVYKWYAYRNTNNGIVHAAAATPTYARVVKA